MLSQWLPPSVSLSPHLSQRPGLASFPFKEQSVVRRYLIPTVFGAAVQGGVAETESTVDKLEYKLPRDQKRNIVRDPGVLWNAWATSRVVALTLVLLCHFIKLLRSRPVSPRRGRSRRRQSKRGRDYFMFNQ